VTSKSSYTDPVSNVTTEYRSVALPKSIGADIDGDGTRDTSYPPEVSATTGEPSGLLRNWVDSVRPVTPPLEEVLPLDPVADLHVFGFASGEEDPDGAVLGDTGRPLVFYAMAPSQIVLLTKTAGGAIRIEF
jgi:hypothetical protein